jgi:hypothetical protein
VRWIPRCNRRRYCQLIVRCQPIDDNLWTRKVCIDMRIGRIYSRPL